MNTRLPSYSRAGGLSSKQGQTSWGQFLFVSMPLHSDVTNDVADAVGPPAIPGSQAIASRTNRVAVASVNVRAAVRPRLWQFRLEARALI